MKHIYSSIMKLLVSILVLQLVITPVHAQLSQTDGPDGSAIASLTVSPNGAGGTNLYAGWLGGGIFRAANDPKSRDLKSLLNSDGSMNLHAGFNGSADATGFSMVTGSYGEPRFIASAPGDENWDRQFGISGVNGTVYTVTVSGTDVYVGGSFISAGTDTVGSIAKWNSVTNTWSKLGTGAGGSAFVKTIAVNGSDIFMAGDFPSAGGVSAANIARWNGSSWSALGAGLGSPAVGVWKLAMHGGDLYAVGDFVKSGADPTVKYVARWDGNAWSGLGVNLGGSVVGVRTIEFVGSDIYIGGYFSSVNGIPAANIAKYSGGVWSALNSGVRGGGFAQIENIMTAGTDLFVTGTFDSAGTARAVNIAKWNGSTWSSVGTGQQGNFFTTGSGIAVNNDEVYVVGKWPDSTLNYVSKWNGITWKNIGRGVCNPLNAEVYAITFSGTDIYVGGIRLTYPAGGEIGVERFSTLTNTFHALGNTPSMEVFAVAVSGTDVFVGGSFRGAGTVSASKIAKWNGTTWSALGAGIRGTNTGGAYVKTITVSGSKVYVGGLFNLAGTVSANNIAMWDDMTQTWSALGSGVTIPSPPLGSYPIVYAITIQGTDVYVGGTFTQAGGITVNRIAKWNGSTWSAIGTGITSAGYPDVRAIMVNGPNDIYAGGNFPDYLRHWNGTTWSAFGPITGSIGSSINALLLSGTNLYVGGVFRTAGGVSVNGIAKWDGSTWSALGTGVSPSAINSMVASGTDIIVGGGFSTAGGLVNGKGIARWDGAGWSTLGSGMTFGSWDGTSGVIAALAKSSNSLFVGGSFTSIGGKWSNYFARWNETITGVEETQQHLSALSLAQNYPNPFKQTTKIRYEITNSQMVTLKVYDLFGKEIKTLVHEIQPAGIYEVDFNASGIVPGIYVYTLQAGSSGTMKKMIILK